MNEIGKVLIVIGIIIIIMGLLMIAADKLSFIGKLPGDIVIKKKNFVFYFPLATSILLSIILSFVFYFLSKR
ncbi:MAG TPA: DUF2905 domain-containing protein [Thermodesulfovibrio thiophilus]|uniref:DUF2905 domain-containing protein n=1 Tax=Thermodesulfovibrio thiophilus TaxID=340095 RepID=UPI0004094CA3|nr:DUF2905 domain-containing protein [Thermodesulfovibrio thiophilus]HOA82698.1 DUF2905 domain-containing protein [Thermodesulfovibrio thiophilus]HQA03964.1 DUF2905 domain-containing protein [Thermodesulfovibrio thiophilus]HQD35697.1 DUF2905 domain-containing protein [Thermodesulfovibrio thiophilus]